MNRDEEWLLNEKYLGERTEEFFADCERLKVGEPLAYVIGHIPFLDTTIFLDLADQQDWAGSRPLIPRTETEYWVKEILTKIVKTPQFRSPTPKLRGKILDLCAGSGCIGVAMLKALPESRVDFCEIDTGLHPTILRNIRENDIDTSRAQIYGGDLFEHVTETYDYILANPPYINKALGHTEKSVVEHEPHGALFSNDDGFSHIERILRDAKKYLKERGVLVIEHDPEQVSRITTLGETLRYTVESKNDQYGVPRYTVLTSKP